MPHARNTACFRRRLQVLQPCGAAPVATGPGNPYGARPRLVIVGLGSDVAPAGGADDGRSGHGSVARWQALPGEDAERGLVESRGQAAALLGRSVRVHGKAAGGA
eukprot:1059595-Alexandrium_andersonii.AAC.1